MALGRHCSERFFLLNRQQQNGHFECHLDKHGPAFSLFLINSRAQWPYRLQLCSKYLPLILVEWGKKMRTLRLEYPRRAAITRSAESFLRPTHGAQTHNDLMERRKSKKNPCGRAVHENGAKTEQKSRTPPARMTLAARRCLHYKRLTVDY